MIQMGEMRAAGEGEVFRTLLGSCIGIALYDRQRKVGGLAHIVLPESNGKTDRLGKFADTAIPALIEQMEQLNREELKLTARIAGGASMFATTRVNRIGDQNTAACVGTLRGLRIPILDQHCGGQQGRRMTFDTSTGSVVIEIVGHDPIELR
jgi:chemotaxis protein CheD